MAASILNYSSSPARLPVFGLTAAFISAVMLGGIAAGAFYSRVLHTLHDDSLSILMMLSLILAGIGLAGFGITVFVLRRRRPMARRWWAALLLGALYGTIPAISFSFSDAGFGPSTVWVGPLMYGVVFGFPPLAALVSSRLCDRFRISLLGKP